MQHWSFDIRDPQAYVSKIVSQRGGNLDHHQRERLHQYLLIALWELSLNYNPNGRPPNFSGHAGSVLPRRVADWYRSPEEGGRTKWTFGTDSSINPGYRGKTIERPRPTVVSIDSELGTAFSERSVDGPEPGATEFLRTLRERACEDPRQGDEMGEASSRHAA